MPNTQAIRSLPNCISFAHGQIHFGADQVQAEEFDDSDSIDASSNTPRYPYHAGRHVPFDTPDAFEELQERAEMALVRKSARIARGARVDARWQ